MLEMIPVYRNFKNIFLFRIFAKDRAYQKAKNQQKTRKSHVSWPNFIYKIDISAFLGSKNRRSHLDHFAILFIYQANF